MPKVFSTQRRVEFRETDAAGICHFSSFFAFIEEAEHALLRENGLSVYWEDGDRVVSWPRVCVSCEYESAAAFDDVLDIEVVIVRLGKKSVSFRFDINNGNRLVAVGKMTTVCCEIRHGEAPRPIDIPHAIGKFLEPYVVAEEGGGVEDIESFG